MSFLLLILAMMAILTLGVVATAVLVSAGAMTVFWCSRPPVRGLIALGVVAAVMVGVYGLSHQPPEPRGPGPVAFGPPDPFFDGHGGGPIEVVFASDREGPPRKGPPHGKGPPHKKGRDHDDDDDRRGFLGWFGRDDHEDDEDEDRPPAPIVVEYPVTRQGPPPTWLGQDWTSEGATVTIAVSGQRFATEAEALASMRSEVARTAASFLVHSGLAEPDDYQVPDWLVDRLVAERYLERTQLETVDKEVVAWHALVRFDRPSRAMLEGDHDQWLGQQRLWGVSAGFGGLMAAAGLVWLGLRLWPDRRRHPAYSGS